MQQKIVDQANSVQYKQVQILSNKNVPSIPINILTYKHI